VAVEAIHGSIERIKADAENPPTLKSPRDTPSALDQHLERLIEHSDKLRGHLAQQIEQYPNQSRHLLRLVDRNESVRSRVEALRSKTRAREIDSTEISDAADALLEQMPLLKQQSPKTLLRLRVIEITVPLALSIVSILLTLRYPLTEARCYEIKEALKSRHAELAI
jgi:hypothetical protein